MFLIAVCDKRQRPHGCLLGRPEIQHTSARVSPHPSPALPLPAIPMGDPTAVEDGRDGRTVGESIFKTVPLPRNFQMAAPPHPRPASFLPLPSERGGRQLCAQSGMMMMSALGNRYRADQSRNFKLTINVQLVTKFSLSATR